MSCKGLCFSNQQSNALLCHSSRCKSTVTCDIKIIIQNILIFFFLIILTVKVWTTLICNDQREKYSFWQLSAQKWRKKLTWALLVPNTKSSFFMMIDSVRVTGSILHENKSLASHILLTPRNSKYQLALCSVDLVWDHPASGLPNLLLPHTREGL